MIALRTALEWIDAADRRAWFALLLFALGGTTTRRDDGTEADQ